MEQEFSLVKKYFDNHQIQLCDFWLKACIDWFHQEFENTLYTSNDLITKVYEQWLMLDLRDIEIPQLPPNFNNEKKIILNKSLSLQMMSVIDISKSKFSQLQKIKNLNALTRGHDDDDKEFVPVAKRMLELTLTDGLQEIKAVEYKPIPELNINLKPGIKIIINSPIIIRRGQIMLEHHNCKILDGELEEIFVSHAVENVLARHLNLPENPNPSTVEESVLDDSPNEIRNINNYERNQNKSNKQSIKQTSKTDFSNANQQQNIDFDINEDEELRMCAENMLLEIENDIEERPGVATITDQSKLEADIDMLLELEEDLLAVPKTTRKLESPINLDSSLEKDNDIFNSPGIEKHLSKIEEKYHVSSTTEIKDILANIKNRKYGKYKVHAKFKSVTQKLTVVNNKWMAKICITDDLNDLDVYIHTDIISTVTGYTAEEVMNLKKDVKNKIENATNKILKAFEQFKDLLVKLNCLMEIDYSNDETSVIITKLL